MSAIEMMDPKMDVGMVGKRAENKAPSFKQSVEEGLIPLNDLDPSTLILVMDHCQACVLSWLDGQSLVQTVFTCLYLHNPLLIEDRCLKAFCIGILKLCDLIIEKIVKANVYEEEDFQHLRYGFSMANEVTLLRVVGMLKEVEDDYGRQIRSTKSKQHQAEQTDSSIAHLQALLARIKFLRLLLQILQPFGRKEVDFATSTKKLAQQISEQLSIIANTESLAAPVTEFHSNGQEKVFSFEPQVNQRLLPPTFPRYTKLRQRSEIFDAYGDIIKRILCIAEVSTFIEFQNILEFFVTFTNNGPCVLTRSLAQLAVLPPDSTRRSMFSPQFFSSSLRDSIKAFNLPPVLSQHCALYNNSKAKEIMDIFLSRASLVMCKLVQCYGHNYARQREKLGIILEEFAALQDEADRCDSELNQLLQSLEPNTERNHLTCLGSWTLHHTLKVMTQYVLSGFDLQLYSTHEYHYIYW